MRGIDNKKALVAVAALVAALVIYFSFSVKGIETVNPKRGAIVQAVYASGTVEAVKFARLFPMTRGTVVKLNAEDGQEVKKGEVLAWLDYEQQQADVQKQQARLDYVKLEIARSKELTRKKVTSRSELDKWQNELDAAQSDLESARKRLRDRVITAPMDGVVLRREAEEGQIVDTKDVIFWVGQPSPLEIIADVDEEDIALVKEGQKALIKADAFPDEPIEGKVKLITPRGDSLSRNFRVRITLNESSKIRIGMTVEVNIVAGEKKDALLVPNSAFVSQGSVVWVEAGGLKKREVKKGIVGENMTEVLSGLAENDRVVLKPAGLKEE